MTVHYDKLRTDLQIARVDDFYQELIDVHAGLSDQESQKLNAKLVLILSNHIGDMQVLQEAIDCASRSSALS